jgi:hypothetical protein
MSPAEAAAAAWDRTQTRIDRFGIEITAIPLTGSSPPFAYTTGRCLRGLPELLVLGLHPTSAADLLRDLDEMWDHPCVEHQLQAELECEVELVPIPEATSRRYLLQAWRFAEERGLERVEALQVVWADDAGWTPLDPEAPARVRRIQPLVGEGSNARR